MTKIKKSDRFSVWVSGLWQLRQKSKDYSWSFRQVDVTGYRNLTRTRKHAIQVPVAGYCTSMHIHPRTLEACWDQLSSMVEDWGADFSPPLHVHFLDGSFETLDRATYLQTTPRLHRNLCAGYGIELALDLYEDVPPERRVPTEVPKPSLDPCPEDERWVSFVSGSS